MTLNHLEYLGQSRPCELMRSFISPTCWPPRKPSSPSGSPCASYYCRLGTVQHSQRFRRNQRPAWECGRISPLKSVSHSIAARRQECFTHVSFFFPSQKLGRDPSDEDCFFDLLSKFQSSRMDDQRCHLDEPQNGESGGGAANAVLSLNEITGRWENGLPVRVGSFHVCCFKGRN